MKKTMLVVLVVLMMALIGCATTTATTVEELPFVLSVEEKLDGTIIKHLKYDEELLHIEDGEYYYVEYISSEYPRISTKLGRPYFMERYSNDIIDDIFNTDELKYFWRYKDNVKNKYYTELQKVSLAYKNMQEFENNYDEMCKKWHEEYIEDVKSGKSFDERREYNPNKRLTKEEQHDLNEEYRKLYQELKNYCLNVYYKENTIETKFRHYIVFEL